MKRMTKRNAGMVVLVSMAMLIPVMLYAASQQGADGLFNFSPDTLISSSEMNHNFDVLGDFMTTYEDAITVDGSRNVGVGVTNPSQALEVNGTVKATSFVGNGSGLTGISGVSQWSNVSGGISYGGGNVGIGMTSPDSDAKLHVLHDTGMAAKFERSKANQDIFFRLQDGNGGYWDVGNDVSLFHISTIGRYGALAILNSTGNIGIGTASPTQKLEIASGNLNLVNGGVFTNGIERLTVDGDLINGGIYRSNAANIHSFQFSNGTEVMRVDSTGNVGIAIASPTAKLDVNGSARVKDSLRIQSTSVPTLAFDVSGTTQAFMHVYSGSVDIVGKSGYDVRIGTDNAYDKMIVALNGNVGIGTTNPAYKLEVNGTIHASGGVSVVGEVISDDYLYNSDLRLKTEILPLEHASEGIACLQGVTYRWSSSEASQQPQLGLIAQEVERCFPEVVSTGPDGYKSVSYARLVAPLIENAKEQQQALTAQQREIARLKAAHATTTARLDARLARLEALLNAKK